MMALSEYCAAAGQDINIEATHVSWRTNDTINSSNTQQISHNTHISDTHWGYGEQNPPFSPALLTHADTCKNGNGPDSKALNICHATVSSLERKV